MLGLIATFVFAAAGCTSAAVIGASVRNALPAVRRLAAERHTLADDRVYLFTLIETPRHDGTPAPSVATYAAPVAAPAHPAFYRVRHRAPVVPLRAAA